MKKLILLLSLLSSVAFGLDKIINAPSGNIIIKGNSNVFDSTLMTDIQATKLGLKQYISGTNYNGGISPTISGSGWATDRAVFIPYQLQDSTWRVKFNIIGTGTSSSNPSLTINGVTFKTGIQQACSTYENQVGTISTIHSYVAPNTSLLWIKTASASTGWFAYCDVELNSKPTWAY